MLPYRPFRRHRKPRPWAVTASQLYAPFNGLWRNLESCTPLWDLGGTSAKDIAPTKAARDRSIIALVGSLSWGEDQAGVCVPQGTSDAIGFTTNKFLLAADRSVLWSGTIVAYPSSGTSWEWGLYDGGGGFLCILGVRADGTADFYDVTSGGVTIGGGVVPLGQPCTMVGVAKSGDLETLWLNGALVASTAVSTFLTAGLTMGALCHGLIGQYTARSIVRQTMGAVWNRALSPGEAQALSADPFALIRPLRRFQSHPIAAGGGGSTGGGTGRRSFVPAIIG